MDKFFEYSLESAISLAVFYLFYWIFMRKSTHFRLNRIIIMFSVIMSVALPGLAELLKIQASEMLNYPIVFPSTDRVQTFIQSVPVELPEKMSVRQILTIIYLAGAVIILARLVYQAIYLHAISRLSKSFDQEGFRIISLDTDMIPFSYFNRIFIPAERISDDSMESVITHEKSHLAQGHYLDLFIIQMATLIQWFNPFIWLFEKSLKEVHEYLADEAVLKTGKDMGRYQAILVNEALGGPVFILTNQLNKSLIKKRILMMKNVKTPKSAGYQALLVIPLFAALLFIFSNPLISQTGTKDVVVKGTVCDRYTNKPVIGANIIIKNKNIGTVCDTLGRYEIIVTGIDDELVVSFIGYKTQIAPVGKNSVINVNLEPDIMAIEFDQENTTPVNNQKQKEKTKEPESGTGFVFTEQLPSYAGGTAALQKFIQDNIHYPAEAKKKGLEGTVLVLFIIDENGKISTKPQVIRGISPELDNEAIRITGLTESGWTAGNQGGRPVPTTVTMPVEFKLED